MHWFDGKIVFFMLLYLAAQATAQQFFDSANGMYKAVLMKGVGGPREDPFESYFTLELFDSGGVLRYKISSPVAFDAPYPDVYITDYGEVILIDGFAGTASFYSTEGVLSRTVELFKEQAPEHERVVQAATAGNLVTILYSDPRVPSAQIGLYDIKGHRRWTRSLDQQFAYRVELLPRSELIGELKMLIVVSTYGARPSMEPAVTTSVINVGGDVLAHFPILFRHAGYSLSANLFVLADQKAAIAIRTEDFIENWNWRLSGADTARVITAVAAGDGGEVVIQTAAVTMVKSGWVFRDPAVLLFQREGTLVWRRDLPGVQFTSSKLKIVDSELKVQLGAGREITIRLFD